MFQINNKKVEKYEHFLVIRDFYKYPDEIVKWITSFEAIHHKHPRGYFSQGTDFEDMRHHIWNHELKEVYDFLSDLVGQKVNPQIGDEKYYCATNYTYFYQIYKNKHFYPHLDSGMTALVYLDKMLANGTNLYKPVKYDWFDNEEHKDHYIDEDKLEVIAHTPCEYNKLVIWDGKKHYHGLCQDEKYINKWRLNQVFFFQE